MSKSYVFRETFEQLPGKITWFPGHMNRAMRKMLESMKKVDLFIEVRDARIPITSANGEIVKLVKECKKHHIILLNKIDLANGTQTKKFRKYFEYEKQNTGIETFELNACTRENLGIIKKRIMDMCSSHDKFRTIGTWTMIGGLPNVGKSTIINSFRYQSIIKTKGAHTAPTAGITRGVDPLKISLNPLIYLIDSPGIMFTRVDNVEDGLKLAICGCIRDGIVEREVMADYILYSLNKGRQFAYTKKYGLKYPTDNIELLLKSMQEKYKQIHLNQTTIMFVKHFQEGKLGRISLDQVPHI